MIVRLLFLLLLLSCSKKKACITYVPISFDAQPGVKSIYVHFYDGDKMVGADIINRQFLPRCSTTYQFDNIKSISMIYWAIHEDGRKEEFRKDIIK